MSGLQSDLNLAVEASAIIAPLGGPDAVLAQQLLSQGLQFWTAYQAKMAAGTLTMADVDAAAAKTGSDLAQLKADIEAAQA